MLPPPEDIKNTLEGLLPAVSITVENNALVVLPQDIISVCRCLKETNRFSLDYISSLTAVDFPPDRIEIVFHLYSMKEGHGPVTLKVNTQRGNPKLPSVTSIWRGAEFQEREVYDLFGVTFEGHPDLRRILMWDEFVGHPMRKDYVDEDQDAQEGRAY